MRNDKVATLASRGYTDPAIRVIVAHARRHGSCQGCCWLCDQDDTDACEEAIPGNAHWWPIDATNDFYCWSTAEAS